jgi:branched-chain amino acid aminotransferase
MLQKFDARNADLMVFVKDRLVHRNEAHVSVFDSCVQGGDAVWEGLRVYAEGIFALDHHLTRMQDSAHAMMFADIPDKAFIRSAIAQTLAANDMRQDVHIRLTLTRGVKVTSGMDPRLNTSGSTLIVLAEFKPPVYDNAQGIRIITSAIRRNGPGYLDSKMHHNNLINNILAKIQANVAGADAGLMLDDRGFVAELNGTNIFMVRDGVVYTPHADACLPGITRKLVLDICRKHLQTGVEAHLSLTEFYNADEVFCTGTMGELTPIREIDGRTIVNKSQQTLLPSIRTHFESLRGTLCEVL